MLSKTDYIDISVSLSPELPVWPGGYGFHKHQVMSIRNGADANVTRLDFDVHSGTHIDAPLHFLENGFTTNEITIGECIGVAFVAECTGVDVIGVEMLDKINIPAGTNKILFKTDNSARNWYQNPFDTGFVAIDNNAAGWLVQKGIRLVGIDGPSIQKYHDTRETHVTLLSNDVIILEGLNLADVAEGVYELICLPIKADQCEGISARAILKTIVNE